jgi:hypothetical protein
MNNSNIVIFVRLGIISPPHCSLFAGFLSSFAEAELTIALLKSSLVEMKNIK